MSKNSKEIRIVPAAMEYVESFRECLDAVARERRWLGIVEAFPLVQTREFVAQNIAANNPQFLALEGSRVVGWGDIRRNDREDSRHRGELGMGVHRDYRGQGLGTRLLRAALKKAGQIGLMRVELAVYASNPVAIALYRKLGFVEEGRMLKGRYLDGRFDDIIRMVLFFEQNVPKDSV